MFRKIQTLQKGLQKVQHIQGDVERLRYALGCLEADRLSKGEAVREFRVFSQWGEDGIIQWLIKNLPIDHHTFIEFGVQDYTESNTRFLLMHDNWEGLVIDGNKENIDYIQQDEIYWRYTLNAVHAFITTENINQIFLNHDFQGHIGLLSIDIDGNDYWIWKAIDSIQPDIVICEYNHRYGQEKAVTIPYDAAFVRQKAHFSCIYYGASIQALVHLADRKGYSLVAGNSNGNNIFFVRNELLNDVVTPRDVTECFVQGKFRESRDVNGKLAFLNIQEEMELISTLPLVDVSTDF